MSQADLTAAPVTISLDGTEYRLTRLTDRDISELDQWVRSRFIAIARGSLAESALQSEREETLAIAMREATKITWMSGYGRELIATPDGLARILWQCSRKYHSDIAFETMRSLMYKGANVKAVGGSLADLTPSLPANMPAAPQGTPKKKRKAGKRPKRKFTKR